MRNAIDKVIMLSKIYSFNWNTAGIILFNSFVEKKIISRSVSSSVKSQNNHFSTNVWVYIYSLLFVCCLTNAYLQTTGLFISETSAKPVNIMCLLFPIFERAKNNKTFSKEIWLVGVRVFITKKNDL